MAGFRRPTAVIAALTAAALVATSATAQAAATPTNVNVSQRHLNESEEAIAVNPVNEVDSAGRAELQKNRRDGLDVFQFP